VIVNFDAGKGEKLTSMEVPAASGGTTSTTLNCTQANAMGDFASVAANIGANQTNYAIRINFSKQSLSNPVNTICITYQAPTGDILRCTIYPSPGVCSTQTVSCQN
jgi:hypothetical protein